MSRKKILLVDDSATTLMMEQLMLRGQAYRIVTARNGREAVAAARNEKPDLILLDVVMPEMNGFEACRRIRQEEPAGQMPIIMVTPSDEERHVESSFRSGCNDYITKPIDRNELLTKVRGYLGEAGAE